MKTTLTILLAIALACMMMLSGCTAGMDQNAGDIGAGVQEGSPQYSGNGGAAQPGNQSGMARNGSGFAGRGAFGNITDAQRQQMAQAGIAACEGKAVGDACTFTNASGGAQGGMNGTCSARGGNLSCMPSGMGRRGGQPPGNGTRGGFGQPPQNP